MDALIVSVCVCVCPTDVMPWPLRGVVTAVWQLRSGVGALLVLDPVWASWAQGRQAALQFDGRRKAGPKGTAARKRLELHWGCLGGEWHPLEWRRRAVCGDVRRRKNLVNLTKRLRNSARTVGGRGERDAKDALFTRGIAHWWILWHFASDNYPRLPFKNPVPPLLLAANFPFSWQVRCSGTLGMFCALEETWWRGGKFRGGQRYGFPSCLWRITRISLHGIGLRSQSGLEYILWSELMPADCGIVSWKRQRLADFFFFWCIVELETFLPLDSAHALSSLICACQNRDLHDFIPPW